jgi:hypothetical protein
VDSTTRSRLASIRTQLPGAACCLAAAAWLVSACGAGSNTVPPFASALQGGGGGFAAPAVAAEPAKETRTVLTLRPEADAALATRAPYVVGMDPSGLAAPIDRGLRIHFSRPMRRSTVEPLFHIAPDVAGPLAWTDDRTLQFSPVAFAYDTTYEVSIGGMSMEGDRLLGQHVWTFTTRSRPPQATYPFTLTFDDCGTSEQIHSILDALDDKGMRAIFFPTGACRDQFPWLVPTLMAHGHQVCNHTYSHLELTKYSSPVVVSQIANGVSGRQTGCWTFRPPYGAWDGPRGRIAAAAASLGYRVLMWDVDTRDWAGTPADTMVRGIRARGGIVLFHLHGRNTVAAIRSL